MIILVSPNPATKRQNVKPFLKWAGGKTQLLPELLKHIPPFKTYYEPFAGSAALYFALQPQVACLADVNEDLINCYKMLAKCSSKVLKHLNKMPVNEEFFYELRAADRKSNFKQQSLAWKAARFIYLNKTCYNGLYRVNQKGEFNVPFGHDKNRTLINKDSFDDTCDFLQEVYTKRRHFIVHAHWQEVLAVPEANDFVYLDPPYDGVSDTANFTAYTKYKFDKPQHTELKDVTDWLTYKNVKVLQSNADTPFIRNLYKDYKIIEVQAKRVINSKGNKRGNVTELLIKNY